MARVIEVHLKETFQTVPPERVVRFEKGCLATYPASQKERAKTRCRINNRYFRPYLGNKNCFFIKEKDLCQAK